ncbi:carbohydrate kinase [Aquimarina sp. AU474]|uniref:carbohydrate kinase family protein n=1 Tax=Aquimarina sp. AU474 TaxID=2108529 RepID=UPI000D694295|nr:carbohydrate kinase [Aquimarina sp. AU474]
MKITCFGEVLWDIFPEHKKIGGAPLNVALRLHSMGIDSSIITRIGDDTLGANILAYIEERGMPIHTFQKDKTYKTGEVQVLLDNDNTATYDISKPVAWDFIECSDVLLNEVAQSDAFIFGSLSSRNEVSRKTLFQLLDKATYKILDVNLRPPHYNVKLLSQLMRSANFIKLNEEEVDELCADFHIKETLFLDKIYAIATYTQTDQICVTRGEKGATLFFENNFYHNNGYAIKVVDTVGAGDSFLATLISELIQGNLPQIAIDYACAVGAMVAASEGANTIFTQKEVIDFIRKHI